MTKRTILIVDDQNINRRILNKILSATYDTLEASNGEEALSVLREHVDKISAVLLDIVMPVMNGYAVLEAMGEDKVLSKIPVIVSSQRDGDEAEIKALSLGAQDFIAKPYKGEIILRRLSNLIKLRETAALINKIEKDELTGLYNKQYFLEKVEELLQQNPDREYDLISFGIERFKLINDMFGTKKGDEFLQYIAKVLEENQTAIYMSRFTGDLFYMLLSRRENYDAEQFFGWMQKINEFPIDMDIKVNCGIYEITDKDIPVSTMCDRAQLAAEKNKRKYDILYCYYDDSIRETLLDEQFILGNIRTALGEKQFHVYYQPKYDLNNELMAGAEALVRWIHPTRGFISPGEFIPLFEKNGFITQLDQYVWETACQDIRQWMDKGYPPIAISVNVSRADIYNPKLVDILVGLLEKYQVPIQYLHLEITESAYTTNPNQIVQVVNRLREIGFIIEMDDFGSGYSSLNMLAEMPVDILKLDMRFIQNETSKSSGRGILSFVISLAKWLNLAVVAEGVETGEQLSTLRAMDCNYGQGYYYAHPMKESEFEALLQSSQTTEMICDSQTGRNDTFRQESVLPEKGRKILIVDDMELDRVVLAGIFADEYTVIEREWTHCMGVY